MPVDNEHYDRLAPHWWDERQPHALLLTGMNPARFGYFREVLIDRLKVDPRGKRALDIGCGGGFLAEEFARLGCRVVGVDPSEPSLQTARAHARESGLDIEYRTGVGESLPAERESFDIVYCCDVLEHVDDLDKVIAETARVLKPGGAYFYDTINRTFLSKLLLIKLAQEWGPTRLLDFTLHDWNMFIKPGELQRLLARHGLETQEIVGLKPRASPAAMLAAFWKLKRGEITYGEFGRRVAPARSSDSKISYMGYAVKR